MVIFFLKKKINLKKKIPNELNKKFLFFKMVQYMEEKEDKGEVKKIFWVNICDNSMTENEIMLFRSVILTSTCVQNIFISENKYIKNLREDLKELIRVNKNKRTIQVLYLIFFI